VVTKISELSYEITVQYDKKQNVHIIRLTAAYDPTAWKPKPRRKAQSKPCMKPPTNREKEQEEDKVKIGPFPLQSEKPLEARTPPNQSLDTPQTSQHLADTHPPLKEVILLISPLRHGTQGVIYRPLEKNHYLPDLERELRLNDLRHTVLKSV
jgi:hypothetical protein